MSTPLESPIPDALGIWENTGIDYSIHATPFTSRFSEFCVHFPAGGPLGAGRIGLRANPFLYGFVEPLAACELRFENEEWLPVRRGSLQSLPWCAVETSRAGALRIEGTHVFATGRRMVSRFRFLNDGNDPLVFDLRWKGRLPGHEAVPEQYLAPFPGLLPEALESWLEASDQSWRGGWRSLNDTSDYPQPSFQLTAVGWPCHPLSWPTATEETRSPFPNGVGHSAGYALEHKGSLRLEAKTTQEFLLVFDLDWKAPGVTPEGFPSIEMTSDTFENLLRDGREWFRAHAGADRSPADASPALEPHIWRARHALLRTGFQAAQGEFGGKTACFCTSDDQFFSTVFFWDALFSTGALSTFQPEFAKDAIHCAFVRQDPRDGSSPENKWNYTVPQRHTRQYPQAPVGSWAVSHYLASEPQDLAFLEEIYPVLCANHRYWEEFADADRDGLAEWQWSGQTADNSPLYDAYVPGGRMNGCQWLPPIASVQLNCFLYRDADLLESFARQINKPADADRFATRKQKIYQALMEVCWVEKERRFWDFNHATRKHTKIRTFYMFWPLFARLPMPEDWIREVIEDELLNPSRFFGTMPFPSVAYDEPTFDASGYWRGKAWPHIAYWLIETLTHYGYTKEALQAAGRITAWQARQTGFPENMETDPRVPTCTGHTDYNWGIAAFHLLATKRFLKFIP